MRFSRHGDIADSQLSGRQRKGLRGGDYARYRFPSVKSLLDEQLLLLRSVIAALGKPQTSVQDVLRFEAQIDMCEREKAAGHQACAYKERHGKRDFGNDKSRAKFCVTEAAIHTFAAAHETFVQIAPNGVKSWCEAANKSCQD